MEKMQRRILRMVGWVETTAGLWVRRPIAAAYGYEAQYKLETAWNLYNDRFTAQHYA
jgi:hypothetical protein